MALATHMTGGIAWACLELGDRGGGVQGRECLSWGASVERHRQWSKNKETWPGIWHSKQWETLSRLPVIPASVCDGCRRVPTLLVLTRLAQSGGRLAAESVLGKVKAKNIPGRRERRGPRVCGLYAAPSLLGAGNHRALCWDPLLQMTESLDY